MTTHSQQVEAELWQRLKSEQAAHDLTNKTYANVIMNIEQALGFTESRPLSEVPKAVESLVKDFKYLQELFKKEQEAHKYTQKNNANMFGRIEAALGYYGNRNISDTVTAVENLAKGTHVESKSEDLGDENAELKRKLELEEYEVERLESLVSSLSAHAKVLFDKMIAAQSSISKTRSTEKRASNES